MELNQRHLFEKEPTMWRYHHLTLLEGKRYFFRALEKLISQIAVELSRNKGTISRGPRKNDLSKGTIKYSSICENSCINALCFNTGFQRKSLFD